MSEIPINYTVDGVRAIGNALEMDFDEISHTYKDRETGRKYTSVSIVKAAFSNPFDSDYWSKRKANEEGKEPEDLIAEWNAKGSIAAEFGTAMHKRFEFQEFKEGELPFDDVLKAAYEEVETKLESSEWESELRICCPFIELAGTADIVYIKDGKYCIFDLKTDKDIKKNYGKKMRGQFSHLADTKLNMYKIQLRLYGYMLESEGLEPMEPNNCGYLINIPRIDVEEGEFALNGLPFKLGKHKMIAIDEPAFTFKEAISVVNEAKELLIQDAKNEAEKLELLTRSNWKELIGFTADEFKTSQLRELEKQVNHFQELMKAYKHLDKLANQGEF